MIKKLIVIGNSYGLLIDKAILDLLRITPDTELEISTDGRRLIIEPHEKGKTNSKRPRSRSLDSKIIRQTPRYGFPKKHPW